MRWLNIERGSLPRLKQAEYPYEKSFASLANRQEFVEESEEQKPRRLDRGRRYVSSARDDNAQHHDVDKTPDDRLCGIIDGPSRKCEENGHTAQKEQAPSDEVFMMRMTPRFFKDGQGAKEDDRETDDDGVPRFLRQNPKSDS